MQYILPALTVIVSTALIDLYIFTALKSVFGKFRIKKVLYNVYWAASLFCYIIVLLALYTNEPIWYKPLRVYGFGFVFIVYFSKILAVPFLLIDEIRRLFSFISRLLFRARKDHATESGGIPRSRFLSMLGIAGAAIPFASLLYGMAGSAFDYRVRKVRLSFSNLPRAFNGLKIVQVSDIHAGSFVSSRPLEKAVDMILLQGADLIFFTGDLVNDRVTELEGLTDILGKLSAPLGVFSILGNHDYGDYYQWKSPVLKRHNLDLLKRLQRDLGWNLLLNENHIFEKDGEKIGLIGVENWSRFSHFRKYGDLEKALKGTEELSFRILLSHDPSHWKAEVVEKHPGVDLTLSGHTHGMQFGVEIPGFRWSPVKYFYPEWADLYKEKKQYLYVNRGLGFLGYPGRVGILPEITVIELFAS